MYRCVIALASADMASLIPAGYHLQTVTFSVTGSSRNAVITCGGANGALANAAAVNALWRSALTSSSSKPYFASQFPSAYQIVEMKTLMNIGGFLFTDVNSAAITGTNVADPASMNTAMLINKVTGIAGRKYRGRMFTPVPTGESTITVAGLFDSTVVSVWNGKWANVLTDLVAGGLTPVLLHTDASTPTPITGFTVTQKVGTIGRRIRR